MEILTAHDKTEFNNLLNELPGLTEELHSKQAASDALFIYLMRLRTGRTYDEIALDFGISASTVRRRCSERCVEKCYCCKIY